MGHISQIAADALKRTFPQCTPQPWRGSEGASASVVTVNYGVVKTSLRKDRGLWWAEASGNPSAPMNPVSEFASNASEAVAKLKKALCKSLV